jgi:hypothetical protein
MNEMHILIRPVVTPLSTIQIIVHELPKPVATELHLRMSWAYEYQVKS